MVANEVNLNHLISILNVNHYKVSDKSFESLYNFKIISSFQKALTLVKTCEPTTDMMVCRAPRDWSLLALQNIRTGKSHYLVICRCTEMSVLGKDLPSL